MADKTPAQIAYEWAEEELATLEAHIAAQEPPMRSDLSERVVRAMDAARTSGSDHLYAFADAAIAICFEEAARVAEEKADNHGWNYHLPSVGREIAAALRSMARTGGGND